MLLVKYLSALRRYPETEIGGIQSSQPTSQKFTVSELKVGRLLFPKVFILFLLYFLTFGHFAQISDLVPLMTLKRHGFYKGQSKVWCSPVSSQKGCCVKMEGIIKSKKDSRCKDSGVFLTG